MQRALSAAGGSQAVYGRYITLGGTCPEVLRVTSHFHSLLQNYTARSQEDLILLCLERPVGDTALLTAHEGVHKGEWGGNSQACLNGDDFNLVSFVFFLTA